VGVDAEHRQLVSAAPVDAAPGAERRQAFRAGQRAILQSLPGTAAWALICGVALVKGGLPVGWALAMSVSVYAASAQLATLPMVIAGAPLWVLVATGFITNLRFVIYSAALRPYFVALPLRTRAALGFFMTDFTFLLFMRGAYEGSLPDKNRDAWFAGACATNYVTWQVCASIGIMGASFVPTNWGLEFTGTLALVALMGPALSTSPAIVGAVLAATVALLAHGLPFRLGLFCGAVAGIAAATLVDYWRPAPPIKPQGAA
jgi:predicted branched-subunit amino acid permease